MTDTTFHAPDQEASVVERNPTVPKPKPKWWRFKKFRRDERGVTAIEFAIISPIFFAFIFAIMEISFWFVGMQVLENAVDQVGRKARTGEILTMSQQDFITEICDLTVGLLPDCENKLIVTVQPFADFNSSGFTDNTDADGNLDSNATSSVTPCPPNAVCVVEAEFEWDLLLNIPSRFGHLVGTNREQSGMEISSGGTNGKTILKATMVFRAEPYL